MMWRNGLRPATGEVLIELMDNGPDDLGRSYFAISWPEDNQWRGGDGVSSQVQHASLEDTMDRWHRNWPADRFVIVDTGERIGK
jgi:hypothetical protein